MKRRPFLQSAVAVLTSSLANGAEAPSPKGDSVPEGRRPPLSCPSCGLASDWPGAPDAFSCPSCRSGVWTDFGEMFADMTGSRRDGGYEIVCHDVQLHPGFSGHPLDGSSQRVWRMALPRVKYAAASDPLSSLFLHIWREWLRERDSARLRQLRAFLEDLGDPAKLDAWIGFSEDVRSHPVVPTKPDWL